MANRSKKVDQLNVKLCTIVVMNFILGTKSKKFFNSNVIGNYFGTEYLVNFKIIFEKYY